VTNASKTASDSESQQASKSAKKQGVTASKPMECDRSSKPSKVPVDDRSSTADVTSSDKLNNKLGDKPTAADPDLVKVVEASPKLPEHIKTTILPLVHSLSD